VIGVPDPVAFTYRAFLSYSHRDTTWAKWLHRALEGFRVDKDLIGRDTPAGPVPKSLRPIFRDREDFSAGHSLTEQTAAALDGSRFMIVLCSPNAAKSQYVNEEIRRFKAMGRGDRIIPLIIDGEPGDPERECFPPALRFKLHPDGSVSDQREEPIAADARPEGDGKELAKLKIVSALLGIGLDQVVRRAERARRRRNRFWGALAGVFLLLAVTATGGLAWARYELSRNEELLDRTLARATGLVDRAVEMSDRFGVPRTLSLGILEEAEKLFRDLAELGRQTSQLRFRKALMLLSFAENFQTLGRTNEALSRAIEARNILLKLVAEGPEDEVRSFSLSVAHATVGVLYSHQRNLIVAIESLRASVAISEAAIAKSPQDPEWHQHLMIVRLRLGDMLVSLGRIGEATENYRSALDMVAKLAAALGMDQDAVFEEHPELRLNTLDAANRFGGLLLLQGRYAEAEKYIRQILAVHEQLAAEDEQSLSLQSTLADSQYRLANVLVDTGSTDEAMALFRKGFTTMDRISSVDPHNVGAQRMRALFKDGIGRAFLAAADAAEALRVFRENLTAAKVFTDVDPGNVVWQGYIAIGHERVGDALVALHDYAAALSEYRIEHSIIARLVTLNDKEVDWQHRLALSHFKIGEVLRTQGGKSEAREQFSASLAIYERLAAANPDLITFRVEVLQARWRALGGGDNETGRYEEILRALRQLRDAGRLTVPKAKWLVAAERQFEMMRAGAQ
jgi:tetratricopeptide (TPR) repeat protein